MARIEHAVGLTGTSVELVFTDAELAHLRVVDAIIDRARDLALAEVGEQAFEQSDAYRLLQLPLVVELDEQPRSDRLELGYERTTWAAL